LSGQIFADFESTKYFSICM